MLITDFGYNGEGVGRVNEKVCFVPYTLVGEDVEVKVVKENTSFIKAVPTQIIEPSQKRKVPPCPYYAQCGGCDFQHMAYADELELKKNILARQLSKVRFGEDFKIYSSKREYAYRNKIKLFTHPKGLGLKQAGSDKVVAIDKCLLIDDEMNKALTHINFFVKSFKLEKYLENVIIKKHRCLNVWFVFSKEVEVDFMGLSLALGNNSRIYASFASSKPVLKYGDKDLEMTEFGIICEERVDAFHQVNDDICNKLYNAIMNKVEGKKMLNAYSGAGLLSGAIAKQAKQVVAIELGEAEHESAEKLKARNGIKNLQNLHGDCGMVLNEINETFDCVVVDPPRSGCDKLAIEAINASEAKQIIYVSCNPASFVRDVARLSNYKLKTVELFDMFPRTANFEVLASLEKIL